ncbi:hypothetical protein MHB50_06820 [Siminovitchia sp. FSL H7-0308]|uniref:Uncharacterized protein n=1 Tax=Siminovitchia thermophila TaxID=1245522 RepID=A0ABS2RAZ2_9BACI|nr:hypothetical protein [Siminovitchia thermophila]MBM7716344.1 hypothetical protein [Siminovitchia thermophila]
MMITNHPNNDHCSEYQLEVERMIYEGGGVFEDLHIRTAPSSKGGKPPEQKNG